MKLTLYTIISMFLLMPPMLCAQTTSGTIFGSVRDASGLVTPGVSVTATHIGTATERAIITDDAGRFRLASLPLGEYQLKAELPGFKAEVRTGILVTIGSEIKVDFTLVVGEVSEEMTISANPPAVETTTGTLAGLVYEDKIKSMPLNGRSFQQLALLEPGVTMAAKSTGNSFYGGKGTRIATSGTKPYFGVFLLDGSEINDAQDNPPNGVAGQMLGVEAIREFKVLTSNYDAEYSRSAGSVISVVTKSGTNDLHGSLYEFHRNSALDARNFFDRSQPSFKRNQFGFEFDGPIVRDKTFFLLNYEGLREGLGRTLTAFVPDAEARKGILPGQAPFSINKAIVPYLAVIPLPNGPAVGPGTGTYVYSPTDVTRENMYTAKLDHKLSNKYWLIFRYRLDEGNVITTKDPIFGDTYFVRMHNAVLEERSVFTSNVLNTFRLSLNRPLTGQGGHPKMPLDASLQPIPGSGQFWSTLEVPGVSITGQQETVKLQHNAFQISNDTAFTRGAHQLKWGVLARFLRIRDESRVRIGGRFRFASLFDFLTNRTLDLQTLKPPVDPLRYERQNLFGLYLQDDLRVLPRLTLNLGLRYEFTNVPTEEDGKMMNLRNLMDSTVITTEPLYDNPSYRNFAPRFGLAWDVFGDSRTVVRGGAGLFHYQITTRIWQRSMQNAAPYRTLIRVVAPPFPITSLDQLNVPGINIIDALEFDVKTPYTLQWNLTVEREAFRQTVIQVGYVGNRGVHLPMRSEPNIPIPQVQSDGRKFFPAGAPRRNPNFSTITLTSTGGNSFYHSLRASVQRRFIEGLQIQASYTFSKVIDEAKDTVEQAFGGSPMRPQDPFNRRADRGLSEIDVRNNFVANWSYELPFGDGTSGVEAQLLRGWTLSGILTIADGSPFSVWIPFDRARSQDFFGLRPNLRPGSSNNPILGRPDAYFDISAFQLQEPGYFGNLGRNTLIGPGLANLDLSVSKDFPLREELKMEFRVEIFNALNRSNFDAPLILGQPIPVPVFTPFGPIPSSARLTQTTTTARQIQFALKILF
ncbi:MAG: TonB-dependent receptor [Acidobacteria bacterium]|nr:TonB-dependent receptor [Acidobacteriota bacterium]